MQYTRTSSAGLRKMRRRSKSTPPERFSMLRRFCATGVIEEGVRGSEGGGGGPEVFFPAALRGRVGVEELSPGRRRSDGSSSASGSPLSTGVDPGELPGPSL